MSDNQTLQTILRESLRAYEQARAAHLRSEQAAAAAFTRATAELNAAEQAERARLEAEHRARRATAAGEQARLGDLAAAVTSLEEAARTALAQAGLAHIAGAPAAVDDPPAKARRGDAEVTQLFVQAQTSYVALREAILKLAQAQVAAGQWDAARQTLKPLLAEKDAPLFEAAFAVQRESYLRPAQQALTAGQWEEAREWLAPWLKGNKDDSEAERIRRASFLDHAQALMHQHNWIAAREAIDKWLQHTKNDREALVLRWETFYSPGKQAFYAGNYVEAFTQLQFLAHETDDFRGYEELLLKAWENLPSRSISKLPRLRFLKVPAGRFLYGDNKSPMHLEDFWIAATPITNALFKLYQPGWQVPTGKEDHPVVNVSWDDAQGFCKWAGVRLPTEQEWEKAARGTDGRKYPWGDQAPTNRLCNFNSQVATTTSVGSCLFGASPYGLLDMAGNVWEWCNSVWSGEAGGYVIRGGAYHNNASGVGCSSRDRYDSDFRRSYLGFRVVAP